MKFVHAFILVLELSLAACFLLFLDSIKDSIDLITAFYIGIALVFFGSAVTAGMSVWLYYQFRGSDRPSREAARAQRSQSGNIFFALFGAVALVGVVGATLTTVLKGPVTGLQRVTKYTVAENNMIAAGKLALIAAGLQAEGGDCDGDGMIEPVPFSTTGDGPFPDGGGYLPAEIGASRQDPWGNLFGYCVWDHGVDPDDEADNDGECGQSTAYLAGDDSEQHIVLAVISAGPDRMFQTDCGPHPDYVTKAAGSDDIVLAYTYAEAGSMSGGLWRLKSGDSDTAEVGNRNIEVTGSSGSDVARIGFDEGLGLSGVGEFLAIKTDNVYAKTPSGAVIMQSPLRVQMVDELDSPGDGESGGAGGGSAPAGNVGEIQFNDGEGALAADAGLRWDNTTKRLFLQSQSAAAPLSAVNMQTGGNNAHGIYVSSKSDSAAALYGEGVAQGVFGLASATNGTGVYGFASAISGSTYGGLFAATSPDGIGVQAAGGRFAVNAMSTTSGTNQSTGVRAIAYSYGSANSTGITATGDAATGRSFGVIANGRSGGTGNAFGGSLTAQTTNGHAYGFSASADTREGTGYAYGGSLTARTTNGRSFGLHVSAESAGGLVWGADINAESVSQSATGIAVSSLSDGKGAYGIDAKVTAMGGAAYGIRSTVKDASGTAYGVYGDAGAAGTTNYGGYFRSTSSNGYGLYCSSSNASGCGGNHAWTNASDSRLKRDIVSLDNRYGLDAIMRLRPVSYTWRNEGSGKPELGFIAQDVETILPALVGTGPDTEITGEDGTTQTITDVKSLSYAGFVVPLVKAVQELKADNDKLRAELEALKAQISSAEGK